MFKALEKWDTKGVYNGMTGVEEEAELNNLWEDGSVINI